MREKSLEDIVEEVNSITLDPDKQSYNEYIAYCERLRDIVADLSYKEDEQAYKLIRNIIPAFDGQERPTMTILESIYSHMDTGEDFLKDILYNTELNEELDPVVLDGTYLKTPQSFTQHPRYCIANFLYQHGELEPDEFRQFIGYNEKSEGEASESRNIDVASRLYQMLTDEEKESLNEYGDSEIFYYEQLKNMVNLEEEGMEDCEQYDKAIFTITHAMMHDRERFMRVLNHYVDTQECTTRDDSQVYQDIIEWLS